jgi:hypothetical protein
MNEIYSITLLISIEFIGVSFLTFFQINPKLKVWVGFLLGLFLIVQASLISFYFFDSFDSSVFIIMALMALVASLINKNKVILLFKSKTTRIDFLLLLAFIVLVVIKPSFIGITADSVQYFAASQGINTNILSGEMLNAFSWYFANGRLIFLNILILLGLVCGVDLVVILLPLVALISIMFVVRLLAIKYDLNYSYQAGLLITLIFFSISIDRFFSHTHYLHTNLLTGFYYCAGVLLLNLEQNKLEKNSSSFLGIMFLSSTILIRKEMLLFALIPVVVYFLLKKSKILESISYVLLYLILGYQWIAYYILKVGHIDLDFYKLFYSGHGGVQDYIYFFSLSLLMPIILMTVKKIFLRINIDKLFFILYFFIMLILLGMNFNETLVTIMKLFGHSLLKIGAWGFYWFALCLSIMYCFKNRINQYLIHIILSFLVVRIGIYVVYDDIVDYGSGDRILLTIFFIGLYLIFDSLLHNSKSLQSIKERDS